MTKKNIRSGKPAKKGTRKNRRFKDGLFRSIFGSAENKAWTLSLYNAVNESSYTNCEDLQIYTIRDAVYMGMKNDASFIFADTLNLFEAQSTYNPNMPLRGLFYLAKQYEKYCKQHDLNLYGYSLQRIPTPRYFVFYNGEEERAEMETMRLSDAFLKRDDAPSLEVVATMINVNCGHNPGIMSACKPLKDYAQFVEYVRMYQKKGYSLSEAIDLAVERAIKENLLEGYFSMHKAEVVGMILSEFDEAKFRRDMIKEGIEIGEAKGRAEGLAEGRAEGFKDAIQRMSEKLNIPEADLLAMLP